MAIYNWIPEAFCHENYVFLWQNGWRKCCVSCNDTGAYNLTRKYNTFSWRRIFKYCFNCTTNSIDFCNKNESYGRCRKNVWFLRCPSQIGSHDCRFTSKTSRSVSLIVLLWILDSLNLTAKFVKISHKSELKLRFWDFNSKIVKLDLFQNGTSSTSGLADS